MPKKSDGRPSFLVVNADESEPGTLFFVLLLTFCFVHDNFFCHSCMVLKVAMRTYSALFFQY